MEVGKWERLSPASYDTLTTGCYTMYKDRSTVRGMILKLAVSRTVCVPETPTAVKSVEQTVSH